MLKGLTKRISNSDFLKSLAILMTGTIIAQQLDTYWPQLSQGLYPEEMGEFAIFQRFCFIATIATARYELALPLPKKDKDAFYLFRFSLKLTVITTSCHISMCIIMEY